MISLDIAISIMTLLIVEFLSNYCLFFFFHIRFFIGPLIIFFHLVFNISMHTLFINIFFIYLVLTRLRNSSRVFGSSRKTPNIVDVTVLLLIFWTPRITIHMCLIKIIDLKKISSILDNKNYLKRNISTEIHS